MVQVSVVVCTYNRCGVLGKSLESLAAQDLPDSVGWEVIVVDNNSGDDTKNVVEGLRSEYPNRFRYVMESRQGVSYARNAGIQAARGSIIAFLDDDEVASPDWLRELTGQLGSGEWAGAGGTVIAQWNCPQPRWLRRQSPFIAGPLCFFEYDPDPDFRERMTVPPFGANMAFRKEMFEKLGGFRTDLGRVGGQLFANEDTEFGRRLMAAGRCLRWEPGAVVFHPVEMHRVSKRYFIRWWFNKGSSDVRELGIPPHRARVVGVPLRLLRDAGIEATRWFWTFDASSRFICVLKICAYAGQAAEWYRRGRGVKRTTLAEGYE